jgi:hypothetical protein
MMGDLPVMENKAAARVTPLPGVALPPGFHDFFRLASCTLMLTAHYAGAAEQEPEDAVAPAMGVPWRSAQIDSPLAFAYRVGDFLGRLEVGLQQRMWLFRHLGNDGRGLSAVAEIRA